MLAEVQRARSLLAQQSEPAARAEVYAEFQQRCADPSGAVSSAVTASNAAGRELIAVVSKLGKARYFLAACTLVIWLWA